MRQWTASTQDTCSLYYAFRLQPPAWLTMALSAETESHIYRVLRTASGAAAHLVALGFTIFVAVLARPGSSKYNSVNFWEVKSHFSCVVGAIGRIGPDSWARCGWLKVMLCWRGKWGGVMWGFCQLGQAPKYLASLS